MNSEQTREWMERYHDEWILCGNYIKDHNLWDDYKKWEAEYLKKSSWKNSILLQERR